MRANDAKLQNVDNISGPKRSTKITHHFPCTYANVIYFIKCSLCKMLYIGETGRSLCDRFREHPRAVERNCKDVSKPVVRNFLTILTNTWQPVVFTDIMVAQPLKSTKVKSKNSSSKLVLLTPTESTNAFHSTDSFLSSALPCSHR